MFKKTLITIICLVLCSTVFGEFQHITYSNVSNNNTLETILRERLSYEGNTFTFRNGLTLDNATNNAFEWNENSEELIWTFATNAVNLSSGTGVVSMDFATIVPTANQMLFTPVSAIVGTVEGTVYYDSDTDSLFLRNASTLVDLGAAAAGNSLDGAYNAGNTIDVNGSPVTMTTSNTDNNRVLDVVQNDATNNPETIRITNTGSGDTLQFVSTGGNDIDGSGSTWSITSAGALTAVSGIIPTMTVATSLTAGSGIVLDSAETITNAVNSEIKFAENAGEDLIFDMDAGTNAVGLKSSTGVDELAMGDVDDLTGVGTITFDTGTSGTITQAGTANIDLTVSQSGSADNSLILSSTGTSNDALQISTSAGGMDLTVAGAAASEDLDLLSNTAINLTSTEAADLAINIVTSNGAGQIQITSADTSDDGIEVDSSGGIDIDAVDVINIDNSGSGKDIRVDSAAGRLELVGGEAAATAIVIDAEDAAGGIDMDFGTGAMTLTGTGVAANLTIDVDALSFDFTDSSNITVTSSEGGEDLTISQIGSNDSSIIITSAGQGANAIELTTSDALGDIDINAGDAITIDAGDIVITTDDTAQQFHVNADGVVAGDAIIFETTSGGIKLLADGSGTGDITLDAEGLISIVTAEAATDQFKVDAQGTGAGFVINLKTTNGGIILNADDGTNGDITLDAASVLNFIAASGITTSDAFTGDGTAALGGFLKTVTNDTEPHAIAVTESGTVLTNLGSNGADAWTLPSAAIGLNYIFVVMAAQEMQITPAGGDIINIDGTAADVAEYWTANAIGETLHLVAVDTTNWIAVSFTGTWTEQTP